MDYLIKPVNPHRLADALQRIMRAPPQTETKPFLPDDRIFLRTGKRARVVYVSQISGIKAEENYTDVLIDDGGTVFMRRTISEWEKLLPKPPFFTPHRSLIVNLQAVGDLVLNPAPKFPLSWKAARTRLSSDSGPPPAYAEPYGSRAACDERHKHPPSTPLCGRLSLER